jgi:hypothetical protein
MPRPYALANMRCDDSGCGLLINGCADAGEKQSMRTDAQPASLNSSRVPILAFIIPQGDLHVNECEHNNYYNELRVQ